LQKKNLYHIAGIKTAAPAYQVAWQLNHNFEMNFEMNLDWEHNTKKEIKSSHTHYFDTFEDVELNWHLIQNKGDNAFLFKSNPLFDYFLFCYGDDIYHYFKRAIASVHQTSKINSIYQFSFELLPKTNPFLINLLNTKKFTDFSQHV